MDNLQDFDKAALAEFGCRMCQNSRQSHRLSHGLRLIPCIWKNEALGSCECFGCDSLKRALAAFLQETL